MTQQRELFRQSALDQVSAATGLDDVTATGIYAAAKAVAELIGEEEEEE